MASGSLHGSDAVLRPLLERHKGCEVWVYLARHAGRK